MSWSEPEVCYADPEACGNDPEPTLVASEDGVTWTAVDTDGLGELDEVTGTADGRVLVMSGGGGGGEADLHTWPADVPLPEADQPATPPTVELVEVPKGEGSRGGGSLPRTALHPLRRRLALRRGPLLAPHRRGPDFGGDSGIVYGYGTVGADGVLEYSRRTAACATTSSRGTLGCD